MTITLSVKANVTAAVQVAEAVTRLGSGTRSAQVRAVNQMARKVRNQSVSGVVSQVNLTRTYVDPKIELKQLATFDNPKAVIAAPVRGVLLSRFGARSMSAKNTWDEAKYRRTFGGTQSLVKPNPRAPAMPWTPRKGSTLRGIPRGQKAAGVKATVKAGSTGGALPFAFLATLQVSGALGVLTRIKGTRKLRARYGPSVDQVVKGYWRENEGDFAAELERETVKQLDAEVAKVAK